METYRLSKYNFFNKRKNKVVGLNLFNKHLFAINSDDYNSLIKHKNSLSDLEEKDPILFSTMYKLGIIENIETDIPAILLKRNREQVFSDTQHRIIIMPTLNCNFSCWYCYESHPKKMMDSNTVDNIMKYIKNLIEKRKITSLHLDWFGGEPLLGFHKVIKPIALLVHFSLHLFLQI